MVFPVHFLPVWDAATTAGEGYFCIANVNIDTGKRCRYGFNILKLCILSKTTPGTADMTAHPETEDKLAIRLQKLCEANQDLARVESVENLVPLLLDLARDVTDAEASSFFNYLPQRQVLQFYTIKDDTLDETAEKTLKAIEIPLGEGIVGWVAREREPLIVADAQKDNRFFKDADKSTGFVTRSILGVPVVYADELLGVMEVLNPTGKKSFDDSDRDLLVSFANLAAVAIFRARLLQERLEQQKLQIQMETAAKIQSLFRPRPPEIGFDSHIWVISQPARFVGGDLYDIIPMPGDSWLAYVADVSDKGLPAALIMAALWYRIRSEAGLYPDVGSLLERLNVVLTKLFQDEGYFATIIIAQYWPAEGRLELACGGHMPALKVSNKTVVPLHAECGPALGVICCPRYEKASFRISKGESVLLYTDGISEAANAAGELIGMPRVADILSRPGKPSRGPELIKEIEKWQGSAEANDDITLLEIWRDR